MGYMDEDPHKSPGERLTLLEGGRDRKDTRVFAHAAAETQLHIRETLTRGSTGIQGSAVPGDAAEPNRQEPGFLEVFPRVASRPPKLLQELEAMLVDRLRSNDKAASLSPLLGKDKDPKLAANLALDAHRQVLSAFVAGFGTYAPLLARIQDEFEWALDEGVRCAQENVHMRLELAANEAKINKAAADARGAVMTEELPFRLAAFSQLQELSERTARATKRFAGAERDLNEIRLEEARVLGQVQKLRENNRKLEELLEGEARWTTQATSPHVAAVAVGPLTAEDEAYLENELGTSNQPLSMRPGSEGGDMGRGSMAGSESGGLEEEPTHGASPHAMSVEPSSVHR